MNAKELLGQPAATDYERRAGELYALTTLNLANAVSVQRLKLLTKFVERPLWARSLLFF